MQATIATTLKPALNASVAVPMAHEPAEDNILAALAEALFSGEHYEIVERADGLYIQPVAKTASIAAVFSPDTRAQREALAMAA